MRTEGYWQQTNWVLAPSACIITRNPINPDPRLDSFRAIIVSKSKDRRGGCLTYLNTLSLCFAVGKVVLVFSE
jgi:hypothetical protein